MITLNTKYNIWKRMRAALLFGLSFIFILSFTNRAEATHIVGGDISYKSLGFSNWEVTLTVRRDCDNGEEPFDKIAAVGIFDQFGNLLPWLGTGGVIQLENPVIDTINTDLDNGCAFIGDAVCVTEARYVGTVILPFRSGGYQLAYQRCCRNVTLDNILDPLNTGSTYTIRMTEEALELENSSPAFDNWPDIYICTDQSLNFLMSATDIDGDSLVYKLCSPFSGATFDEPQPVPPPGPPYDNIIYQDPFTFDNPIPGTQLTINPNTGLLTSVPNVVGQWLVGVCVEEYRNGELLSTLRRDFEYNTRICTEGPMASFEVENPFCDGLEFTIENTSTGADSYEWTVMPDDGVVFDNTAVNPTFTFPANGVYTIQLEAFRDLDGCSSVYIEDVGVYDSQLSASFDASIESCSDSSTLINLVSTSVDPDFGIASWIWIISANGFQDTLNGESVQVEVPIDDNVEITLTATSETGCTQSVTEIFDADPLDLEIVASPMMICQGDTLAILVNPNCDLTYTISPEDFVIYDDPDDPCVISIAPQEMRIYTITATDGLCTATATFQADVIEKADLSISGDTSTCDGNISLMVNGGLPGNQFEWSNNMDFDPLIGDMTEILNYEMQDNQETIFVRVKEGTGCSNVATYEIYDYSIDLSYPESFVACTDSDEEIEIINNDPNQDVTIEFEENDIIVTTTDSSVIISTTDPNLVTTIIFTATNQFGCTLTDTIDITAEQKPEVDFSAMVTCGSLEMCFTNLSNPLGSEYFWEFGDPTTEADTSNEVNPCYIYTEPGDYEVTLYINEGACEGEGITKTITVPVIPEITIDAVDFACEGDSVKLTANANVDGDIVWTENGVEIGTGMMITIFAQNNTTITATITDTFGCEASADHVLEVYTWDLEITGPDIACVDEEVVITLINNSEGDNFTYDWEPNDCIISGEGTTEVIVSASDTKEIIVNVTNNDNGCMMTESFTLNISVISKSLVADPADPFQCQEIEVFVDPADDGCEYLWNTGETGTSIFDTILQTTTYTVTITDENGCTDVESITVDPQLPECDETDVFLPNAFSPNNDGVNDIFRVRSNFVKSMDLAVYDRWGEEVFRTTNIDSGWDGTYKGAELAPDVYAFCLLATCSNGEEYKKTGNVTLFK